MVSHTVNKSVIGTDPREFIDKKIFFKTSEVENVPVEDDEIYLWVTSAPDEVIPPNPKKYVRSDSLLGINRMGRRKDGKPGCYLHCIVQTDVKTPRWTHRLLAPIFPIQLTIWGSNFREFVNHKSMEQH